MELLRTPDDRFENLPDYPFKPHYLTINDRSEDVEIRIHCIDEGDTGAQTVLMLHGEPTWSFLYRKVIPSIVAAGYRVIAPDHIGFGRSDKLAQRSDYSYQRFVDWIQELLLQLELSNITLLCQDWGGPIGLRVLAGMPERFVAVIVTNTLLPNCEVPPKGIDSWPGEFIESWVRATAEADDLSVGDIVSATCVNPLSDEVKQAYDAPFPDAAYKAAVLEFPSLIPIQESMAGVAENRLAWKVLESWEKPFVTAFSDGDPTTKAWERVFQQRVPGAKTQLHCEITNAGHFIQEEQGEALAAVVLNLSDGSIN